MNTKAPKKTKPSSDQPKQDWHPADVMAALRKANWTITDLGKEHGLKSGQTLSKALTQSYPIAEKRIADALGLHPKEIWPSRYFDNGEPIPRGIRGLKFKRINAVVNGKDQAENRHESA